MCLGNHLMYICFASSETGMAVLGLLFSRGGGSWKFSIWMLGAVISQKLQFWDTAIFPFLRDARFLKTKRERQNKLASLGNRYLWSPKHLLVYPIAKEQFRSTSLTRGMLEKNGKCICVLIPWPPSHHQLLWMKCVHLEILRLKLWVGCKMMWYFI